MGLSPGDLVEERGIPGFVGLVIAVDPERDWFVATVLWSAARRGRRIDGHPDELLVPAGTAVHPPSITD